MKTWESWLSHISTIAVTATGLAYLWMKYFVENNDPFSVVNHPWQPTMLSLHVLSAPLLVFAAGLIAQSHIRRKLRRHVRTNRRTGVISMVSLFTMIVSGYALQVVTAAWLAQISLALHIAASSFFVLTYAAHQIISFRLKKTVNVSDNPILTGRQTA